MQNTTSKLQNTRYLDLVNPSERVFVVSFLCAQDTIRKGSMWKECIWHMERATYYWKIGGSTNRKEIFNESIFSKIQWCTVFYHAV